MSSSRTSLKHTYIKIHISGKSKLNLEIYTERQEGGVYKNIGKNWGISNYASIKQLIIWASVRYKSDTSLKYRKMITCKFGKK